MVDRDALSSRLDALESYLAELETLRPQGREAFEREPALHHLGERLLHLSCECVIDMAHHVIAESGYRQAKDYRDAIEVLREEGLLSDASAEKLKLWVGFRNVLVHFYLKVDHGRAFDAIDQDLGELRNFAAAMAGLLESDDEPPRAG